MSIYESNVSLFLPCLQTYPNGISFTVELLDATSAVVVRNPGISLCISIIVLVSSIVVLNIKKVTLNSDILYL